MGTNAEPIEHVGVRELDGRTQRLKAAGDGALPLRQHTADRLFVGICHGRTGLERITFVCRYRSPNQLDGDVDQAVATLL